MPSARRRYRERSFGGGHCVWWPPREWLSTRRQAGQRRTQPHPEEADHVRAQDIRERTEKGALLGQEEPFPGVRAERRVAAQEARDEEQPPQRTDLESFAQIRQHDPDRKR